MKKLFAVLLAVMMVVSMATVVSAENTTTLTTTVPDAEYTLNIPADQVITFNTERTSLAVPTVTNDSGFAVGKNLRVDFTYTEFTAPGVTTTIPMTISYLNGQGDPRSFSVNALIFKGESDGGVTAAYPASDTGSAVITAGTIRNLYVNVASSDWGKALGGEYSATITFSAEIVAG